MNKVWMIADDELLIFLCGIVVNVDFGPIFGVIDGKNYGASKPPFFSNFGKYACRASFFVQLAFSIEI
jgi:hypothetical protein